MKSIENDGFPRNLNGLLSNIKIGEDTCTMKNHKFLKKIM